MSSADLIIGLLLRGSLLVVVAAIAVRCLIGWLRPSSPTVQRVLCSFVLLSGLILFRIPVRVGWYENDSPSAPAVMRSIPTTGLEATRSATIPSGRLIVESSTVAAAIDTQRLPIAAEQDSQPEVNSATFCSKTSTLCSSSAVVMINSPIILFSVLTIK